MKVKVIVVVVGVLVCAVAWVGNNAAGKLSPSQEKVPQNVYPSQSSNSTSAPPVTTPPTTEPETQAGGGSPVPPGTPTSGTSEQFPLATPPRTIVREGQQLPDSRSLEKQADPKELLGEPAPGQSNDNPTGRQEPAVSLEWIGPATCKIGQPVTYQIMVKNVSAAPVQGVVVRNRVASGVIVLSTQPVARNEGDALVWDIGSLEPRQEKRLTLQLQPKTTGDLTSQASVTFTGISISHLVVQEPRLTLKASGPERVLLGDLVNITVVVTNPGNGTAEQVKMKAALSEGLETARGRIIEFDVGSLRPQESRSVPLVCNTKTGGRQKLDIVAMADGGLRADSNRTLEVIVPRIDVAAAGPALRYLGRPATYTFKVTNPGTAPTSNVTLTDQIPDGFKFVSASPGGRHDFATRVVSWYIGDLNPGQSKEVTLDVLAANPGEHRHTAVVEAARGLKNEAQISTRVEGLSALLMELVDLDDPVETGTDTAYEIRVTNTGSKTETNLQLVCTIPQEMEFRSAKSSANCNHHLQGKELVFDPLPKLAPRADAIYRVNVRGIQPGDVRFRAQIMADGLKAPVLKEESTKVYGDSATLPNTSNPNR